MLNLLTNLNNMNKSTKLIIGIFIVLIVIVGGYFVFWKKSQSDVIKIGGVQYLTGPAAAFGQISNNAVNMAVDRINENGGINGKKIELVTEDYGYDPKAAVSAYQKLANEGIKIFFIDGSAALGGVAPLVRNDKNLSFAPSATLPSYTDNNPLTCRLGLTANNYAPAMAVFISGKFSKPRVGFLMSNNEYGLGIEQKVKEEVEKNSGEVIVTENFDMAATDFRTNVAKVKSQMNKIDILVVTNIGKTIEPLLKQLKESGFSKPIITENWTVQNPELKTISLAEGIYFVDYDYVPEIQQNDSDITKNFKQNWFDKYNQYPSPHAANSYDSVNLLMLAIKNTNSVEPNTISDYLINKIGEYSGVGGNLKFNNDCEVQRPITMRVIKNGKSELVR